MDILLKETDADGICRITMNRAEVHNAFNPALISALAESFEAIANDAAVRAVILAGNGKSFSAGADLTWMKDAVHFTEEENQADAENLAAMLAAIYICPVPVIAVAHGAVMGGGVGLLACADTVIAAQDTKFALSEVKIGLTPATISPFVMRAVGERWAKRLFTTGERFTADIALRAGLIHEIAEDSAAATARADALASLIAANAPGAVVDAKALVLDLAGEDLTAGLRTETARRIAKRRTSPEGQEGLSAFLEKRAPNWGKQS